MQALLAADASVGVATTTMSKSSAPEGAITLAVDKLSGDATTANTFNKVIGDNAGGTYTLSGTDAARFAIDAAPPALSQPHWIMKRQLTQAQTMSMILR